MKVDLIDLKLRYIDEKEELLKILDKTLKKGNLVLTSELNEFENNICKFSNHKYCLGLNSGTDALMMSLWSLGIGKGDEVITSPLSFVATIGAIIHVGAKPVFVDVNEDYNIDYKKIEKKITNRTKAILPVHWSGRICNMSEIVKIANKFNIKIIEDAAQAVGSYYKGEHAGYYSEISAFSTHPLKNLNALGDGGFILTNKKKLYEKIKLFRNHGLKNRDDVRIFGLNSRLDVLNAEVLKLRLKKLKKVIKSRNFNVNLYRIFLKGNPYIKICEDKKYEKNSYTLFLTQAHKRDQLQEYLSNYKIQTMVYYGKPLHLQPASKKLGYKKGSLPVAERLCKNVLALPNHQYLKKKQIEFFEKKINHFYKI